MVNQEQNNRVINIPHMEELREVVFLMNPMSPAGFIQWSSDSKILFTFLHFASTQGE